VLLKGESPIKFQAIELAQLQGLLNSPEHVAELHLCSLQVLEDDDLALKATSPPGYHVNNIARELQ